MRLSIGFILLAAAAAHADEVASREATPGRTPEAAFESAVDNNTVVCAPDCAQEVVASRVRGIAVELRRAGSKYGHVYAVVLGQGDTWWATEPIYDIQTETCSTGKCVSDEITNVAITERDGVAWVALSIRSTIDYQLDDKPTGHAQHVHQMLVGCKLDATLVCTRVDAGSHWQDGSAKIGADRVEVREGDARRSVHVTW